MHLPDVQAHAALEALWRSGGVVYPGLSTTVPDDHCTPGSVTEVAAASYQRAALSTDATSFAAAVDRAIQTIVDTTWPAPAEDWGVALAIPLFDTATKGTGTAVGAVELSTGVNILAGGSAPKAFAGTIRFQAP